MFKKNRNLVFARITLALALITGISGVMPVQADAEKPSEITQIVDFLNPDGTLKLDGSVSGSFDLQDWDVRIDDVRGLIFSPKRAEALSPFMATTLGEWSALGDSGAGNGALNGYVHAIAVSGNDVYVGGNFTNAGGNSKADYIAKWDGTTWSNLGDNGVLPSENANGAVQGEVWSIGVNGSNVYVGILGNVWIDGAPKASYVAKWDGANWSGLVGGDGTGNPLNTYPIAFAFIGTDVYVGGFFTNVHNGSTTLTEADYIAKWDGTNWYAVGNDGAGNGSLNNNVHALAAIGGYLVVGGNFTDVKDGATTLTAADYIVGWNGMNWSALGDDGGNPLDGSIRGGTGVYDIEFVGEDIYAVGDFVNVNNKGMILNAADYIAKWDGLNWSALGSNGSGDGAIGNTIFRMAVNRNKIYVGGLFQNVNNNGSVLTAADYVAKWDGTDWSALGNDGGDPLNGSLNSFGEGSVATNGENLYVGGQFTNVNNIGDVLIAADYIAAYGLCTTGPITVQNTNDSGPGSLRQAVADSCPGGTIIFDSSLSGRVITLSSTIVIDTNLTINGSGLSQHIAIKGDTDGDGKGNVRIFEIPWYTVVGLIELDIVEGYAHYGGGILNQGELTIVNSNFIGNEAVFGGGAIYNVHKLTVQGSSFSENRAYPVVINDPDGYGGAIYNIYLLNVTNSTFSLNNVYVKGGGIFNWDNGVATLVNNTIYMNGASSGGDLYSNYGTMNLQNNIIGSCINIGGAIGTDTYNIIPGNNGCGTPYSTDDPLLDELSDNGGPTKTLALLPGSPAKDSGDDANCLATDQRGVTRPQGSHCDIGAYEYVPAIPIPTLPPGVVSHARDFSTPFVPPSGSAIGLLPILTKPSQQGQSAVVPTSTPIPEPTLPTSTPQPVFAEVENPASTPEPVVAMDAADRTAPETTLLVTPGSTSRQRSAFFAYESTEAGTFVCSLDGSAYFACERSIRFMGLSEGMHLFQVRAVDEMGNYDGTPAIYTWLIETNVNIQRFKTMKK